MIVTLKNPSLKRRESGLKKACKLMISTVFN
jgi:hypothetical protein